MPDRLSALPAELLQDVLGFLPAHEAVRTSVLARRWRPLWKSVRRLHVTCSIEDADADDGFHRYYDRTCDFVNSLFLMRGCASLDEVRFDYDRPIKQQTAVWIRHALLCQVQVIAVHGVRSGGYQQLIITLEDPPLVSRHLRKLELNEVYLRDKFLDFASCPALEALEMSHCEIGTERIVSPSLKLLLIDSSHFISYHRTSISVPSLISLQLNDFMGVAPLLESMPLLENASVKPSATTIDSCPTDDWDSCAVCCGEDYYKDRCVLLGGLSSAVNMELTTKPIKCLFERDLRWCPTFSKLRTLLLNDFRVAFDIFALVCILNHSPILENLTLHLHKGPVRPRETEEYDIPSETEENDIPSEAEENGIPSEAEENYTSMEKPAALSRCLKQIKIGCEDFDDKVCDLLRFLTAWGIEVSIKRTDRK